MSEFTEPDAQSVMLNLDKVASTLAFPIEGLQRAKFQITEDVMKDQLITRLSAYVLSEHLVDDTQTAQKRVPVTWSDHLKVDLDAWAEDHPRDLLRRPIKALLAWRPARYRTIELAVTWHRAATRPQSTIRVSDGLGPVVYQEHVSRSLNWL